MSSHVLSCHVMSCHLTSCHVISRLLMSVTSCHIMSCHVMSRHLARESCSRFLNSSIMAAGWPRRGFRNRGPVRESSSERRSRCGAVRTASVRVGLVLIFSTWASFCVAGCGDRARCEHAGSHVAGVSRRCAVGIGFRARFVYAWSTCVLRGRLQGSGVSRACWDHAGGPCRRRCAVGIGFRARRARRILRAAICVSCGRCGTSDAWMWSGRHWTVDPRGRRNESCAVAKIAGFRGPVRQIACAGARWALRNRGRRRESVVLRM